MIKKQHKFRLFVGDVGSYLAAAAKRFDPAALLIDHANHSTVLSLLLTTDITGYTSVGDFPDQAYLLLQICEHADEIFYMPPKFWADKKSVDQFDPNASNQGYTEYLLTKVAAHKPVIGLTLNQLNNPVSLVDQRKTQSPQIWVAGCSISHGVGVQPGQRYGSLLSQELQLPCSFLTRGGSSIDWASDQICRSDIRSGDIVIFGLTSGSRMTYVHNGQLLQGINVNSYTVHPEYQEIIPAYHLITENIFYQQVLAIERCVNFCEKINVKLMLIGLLVCQSANLLRYVSNKPNFFLYPYPLSNHQAFEFKDLGSDHVHPGRQQHNLYKDFILSQLNQAV
jgi:hypothetical protein